MTSQEIRLKMLREQAANEVKVTQQKIALIFDEMIRLENTAISSADAFVLGCIAQTIFGGIDGDATDFWATLNGEKSATDYIGPDAIRRCEDCAKVVDYDREDHNVELCADCEYERNTGEALPDRYPEFFDTNPAGMPK